MRRLVPVALLAAATLATVACGTPPPPACGPQSCEGCCDSQGICRRGDTDPACGLGGVACNVCSNIQTCRAQVCALVEPADAGTDGGVDAGNPICSRTTVACSDQAILQLDLKVAPGAGLITNTAVDGGFKTVVDAVAGGSPPTDSFVYGKFTDTGLTKVSLGDQAALDALDWDIAFRRFVLRLNGGDSGPACTGAVALPAGTLFDNVTAVPGGATFALDDFLTASPACVFVDDGSGLPSSPATALANTGASFYAYTSCVSMTGRVFVVQTRFGRHLKLEVTGYYGTEAAQATCNAGGAPTAPGGTIRLRWAFLD